MDSYMYISTGVPLYPLLGHVNGHQPQIYCTVWPPAPVLNPQSFVIATPTKPKVQTPGNASGLCVNGHLRFRPHQQVQQQVHYPMWPPAPVFKPQSFVMATPTKRSNNVKFPKVTSIEDALKIFNCAPENGTDVADTQHNISGVTSLKALKISKSGAGPAQAPPAGQAGSRNNPIITVDHSLDDVDLEACIQRLLEVAEDSEDSMEFFYDVENYGYLCELQIFGETINQSHRNGLKTFAQTS